MSIKRDVFSKSDMCILESIEKGYVADAHGNIYTPEGRCLSKSSFKQSGHLSVSLRDCDNKCKPVLAHRLIAAYFYGVNALLAQCVRHLNNKPSDNRKDNLAYGTYKENRADIPREALVAMGKRHAAELIANSRKLTDDQIKSMRSIRKETKAPYAKIAEQFGVSAMTAYRAINYQSWEGVR